MPNKGKTSGETLLCIVSGTFWNSSASSTSAYSHYRDTDNTLPFASVSFLHSLHSNLLASVCHVPSLTCISTCSKALIGSSLKEEYHQCVVHDLSFIWSVICFKLRYIQHSQRPEPSSILGDVMQKVTLEPQQGMIEMHRKHLHKKPSKCANPTGRRFHHLLIPTQPLTSLRWIIHQCRIPIVKHVIRDNFKCSVTLPTKADRLVNITLQISRALITTIF